VKKTALLSVLIALGVLLLSLSCQTESSPDPAELSAEVNRLADLYVERSMARFPEMGYIMGFPPERHDGLLDNSPEAVERARGEDDAMLDVLAGIDHELLGGTPEWVTYGMLTEALEAARDVRVCREELWNVSHMNGWQAWYPILAGMQPVGTPEFREQALTRWRKFPTLVGNDIANLKMGLEEGYTANRAVVRRVIQQVDGLLALPAEQSPFMSPAERDETTEFVEQFGALVTDEILPAIERYREFLKSTYVEGARESLAVTANPDGLACYTAMLRSNTTLQRTAEEVFELGKSTVEKNARELVELGTERYGTDDFAEIIRLAKADPADRFADKDDLLSFSRDAVERSKTVVDGWFGLTRVRRRALPRVSGGHRRRGSIRGWITRRAGDLPYLSVPARDPEPGQRRDHRIPRGQPGAPPPDLDCPEPRGCTSYRQDGGKLGLYRGMGSLLRGPGGRGGPL